jgi:formylglycine-generating enzyme required for sulfatase activity
MAESRLLIQRYWYWCLCIPLLAVGAGCSRVEDEGAASKRRHSVLQQQADATLHEILAPGLHLSLVEIPGGRFEMGSGTGNAGPIHTVTVQRFLLAREETTYGLWNWVAAREIVEMPLRPRVALDETLPVGLVSWFEAKEFCKRLSAATGRIHRLPSEAEWEFAARIGERVAGALQGNCDGLGRVRRVGSAALPDSLGLFDIFGNMAEWCEDDFHETYSGAPATGAPWRGEPVGGRYEGKVVRGGSHSHRPEYCTASARDHMAPEVQSSTIGFRVALDPQ